MNTPITDAVTGCSPLHKVKNLQCTARRLELDRAALMEALEDVLDGGLEGPRLDSVKRALSILSTARTNFPTE
jgi:hypothetical protein